MPFEAAHSLAHKHLIPQPADLALDPPESYLYIQDGLIISCGVLYALCYFFYAIRTYRDGVCAGPVEYLIGTMAYEIWYATIMTSSPLEYTGFIIWFLCDVAFSLVAIFSAYPKHTRLRRILVMTLGVPVTVLAFRYLCVVFPDDLEEVTAYWTGWLLELPIGWGSVILLLYRGDTKGQSLEIWATRFLGVHTANGVFVWRYLNVPQNWEYVDTTSSWVLVIATMVPEFVYPFVFWRVHHAQMRRKAEEARLRERKGTLETSARRPSSSKHISPLRTDPNHLTTISETPMAAPARVPFGARPPIVKYNQRAFDLAQRTDPGEACVFLANLSNWLNGHELWEKIRDEIVGLGLEGEVLVVVKQNLKGDVTSSAHIQLKNEAAAETALNHFDNLLIGTRKVRAEWGSGHMILGARVDNGRPSPRAAVEHLVGGKGQSSIDKVRTDEDGGKYEWFDYLPGMVFEFKTVALRDKAWEDLKRKYGRGGSNVYKGDYVFWRW